MTQVQEVSKIEVGERQLSASIDLFFKDGDPIAVHTLSSAAHEILRSLSKHKGFSSILKDQSLKLINELELDKYLKQEGISIRTKNATLETKWAAIVDREYNFLKHAGKDPDVKLEFHPDAVQSLLVDAIYMYSFLKGKLLPEFVIFLLWVLNNTNGIIVDPRLIKASESFGLDKNTKKAVYVELSKSFKDFLIKIGLTM